MSILKLDENMFIIVTEYVEKAKMYVYMYILY